MNMHKAGRLIVQFRVSSLLSAHGHERGAGLSTTVTAPGLPTAKPVRCVNIISPFRSPSIAGKMGSGSIKNLLASGFDNIGAGELVDLAASLVWICTVADIKSPRFTVQSID